MRIDGYRSFICFASAGRQLSEIDVLVNNCYESHFVVPQSHITGPVLVKVPWKLDRPRSRKDIMGCLKLDSKPLKKNTLIEICSLPSC